MINTRFASCTKDTAMVMAGRGNTVQFQSYDANSQLKVVRKAAGGGEQILNKSYFCASKNLENLKLPDRNCREGARTNQTCTVIVV